MGTTHDCTRHDFALTNREVALADLAFSLWRSGRKEPQAIRVDIRHLVEAGNQVAVHFVLTVTDSGGFARRAPTGKRVSSWGVEFWRFDGEQVVEEWIGFDYLGLFIQLGVVPSPWPTATSV